MVALERTGSLDGMSAISAEPPQPLKRSNTFPYRPSRRYSNTRKCVSPTLSYSSIAHVLVKPTDETATHDESRINLILRASRSTINSRQARTTRFCGTIERIRTFSRNDTPMSIQTSPMFDVADNGDMKIGSVSSAYAISEWWAIKEDNSYTQANFINRVVVLDSVKFTRPERLDVHVFVRNMAFEKQVSLRCTFDRWQSYFDAACSFQSCVTPSSGQYVGVDRFVASLDLAEQCADETRATIEFAICFKCAGQEHWDNNASRDYKFQLCRLFKSEVQSSKANFIRKDKRSAQWNRGYHWALPTWNQPKGVWQDNQTPGVPSVIHGLLRTSLSDDVLHGSRAVSLRNRSLISKLKTQPHSTFTA